MGAMCLNRTSVGLKPDPPKPPWTHCLFRPQSNQRGIETDLETNQTMLPPSRLNRTSVGLKRMVGSSVREGELLPQSNQRGIETGTPGA